MEVLKKLVHGDWIRLLIVVAVVWITVAMLQPATPKPDQQNASDLPTPWDYKVIGFRTQTDQNPAPLQPAFTEAINNEAKTGWEFVNTCARLEGEDYAVDYLVFRKKKF